MQHILQSQVEPFKFYGLSIIDYMPGKVESASVAEIRVAPGVTHQTGRSVRSDKFYYCLAGPVSFVVEDQKITLQPSDLLVIAKKEWFSYSNTTTHEARLLLIHVPPFDLEAEEFQNKLPPPNNELTS